MHRSISLFALLVVGWLATACTTPPEPAIGPWLEGPIAWVGYKGVVMPHGFLPGEEHTVVYTAPDAPGEVTMVLLGPGGGGVGVPIEFVEIPELPEEAGSVAEAQALLASLGLGMQLYELEGDDLKPLKVAASDSEVISNHPASPAGTTVAPGTTVGVVIIITRAAPGM